jgi:hypothetical protein
MQGQTGRRTRSLSTGSLGTSGVLLECSWLTNAVQYLFQVLTLALVLGLALKLSRWEREDLWRDSGGD